MFNESHHEMHLTTVYSSGAEEWRCPVCERRILLQWPPHHHKMILNPGDANAVHTGARSGSRRAEQLPADLIDAEHSGMIDPLANDSLEYGPDMLTDELRPWVQWLQRSGLDRHWNGPLL